MKNSEGARAKHARMLSGLSISKAAEKLGVTPSTVQKIESGIISKNTLIFEMAGIYNVSPYWLKYGDEKHSIVINGGKTSSEISNHPIVFSYIGLISWELATKKVNRKKLEAMKHEEWVPFFGDGSLDDSFALLIDGNSMISDEPSVESFYPGNTIYVDQTITPYDGAYVVVKEENSKTAIFRQYIKDCGRFWLEPLNKQFPAKKVTSKITIIGVCFFTSRKIAKPPVLPHLRKKEIRREKK